MSGKMEKEGEEMKGISEAKSMSLIQVSDCMILNERDQWTANHEQTTTGDDDERACVTLSGEPIPALLCAPAAAATAAATAAAAINLTSDHIRKHESD